MTTTMTSSIKIFFYFQLPVLLFLLFSKHFFINFEVAFVSSVLVLLGSMYSYSRLVSKRLEAEMVHDETLEKIEDPYDLYEEIEDPLETSNEEQDLKTVIKEERARLKASKNTLGNMKKTSPALVSVFRLVPYLFLVLGFIALNNNHILDLLPYLMGLTYGIFAGYKTGKNLFNASFTI